MAEKKAFFKGRTVAEIRAMNLGRVYKQRNLVKRILDLDPSEDAIELRVRLTPARFFIDNKSGARASRLNLKHGDLIALSQPSTQREAYQCKDTPSALTTEIFSKLSGTKEEEVNFIGYSFRPVQGNDRRLRVNLFSFLLDGAEIYNYAENSSTGIKVEDYSDSEKVLIEGGTFVVSVPSRTKKNPKYKISIKHVPVKNTKEKRAIVWSLRADYERTLHEVYNIKYTKGRSREESDIVTFYPHSIAAYLKIIDKLWKEEKNKVPFQMCPFALPSQFLVNMYKKFNNNIIIYDQSLKIKHKLRKLHLDELCILIARTSCVFGHRKTLYCDASRDGNLRDYNWGITS